MKIKQSVALLLISILLVTACAEKEARKKEEKYDPKINPANFVKVIDNKYLPLKPGTTRKYKGKTDEGTETNTVKVTNKTKKIIGVTCVVVDDRVYLNGKLIEKTFDWFAQDKDGNVWYFGEDSKEYEDGKVVSAEGSWEAGKNGAKPGIVMKANPKVGETYRQEYLKGEAEDMGKVLALNETATVPLGTYKNLLKTRDWTPLEPDVVENKYYAEGIGVVLEVKVKGGNERVELVEIEK